MAGCTSHKGEELNQYLKTLTDTTNIRTEASRMEQTQQWVSDDDAKTDFTFEDIFKPNFSAKSFDSRWHEDSLVYRDDDGNLLLFNPEIDITETLLDANTSAEHEVVTDDLSPDGRYILLSTNYKKRWRHSFSARYMIYNREKDGTDEAFIEFPSSDKLVNSSLQYAAWSPVGHQLVFVHEHDLYYQSDPFVSPYRVTTTGEELIYNGVTDWLYEEDVLSSGKAVYWSPRGQYLVFATFNDTQVPLIEFPEYGPPSDVYGSTMKIPYPKAGDVSPDGELSKNPTVILHVFDVVNRRVEDIPPPPELANEDYYYTSVNWATDSDVMITWSNRVQNYSIIASCDVITLDCSKVREDFYPMGWNPMLVQKFWFIDGGTSYVTEAPREEASSGPWTQVALMSRRGGTPQFLTRSEDKVIAVLGVDKDKRVVYYRATNGDPKQRHIFRVGLPGASQALSQPVCLTCDDVTCSYNSASFSKSAKYYKRSCWGPGIPTQSLVSLSDNKVTFLENNTALLEAFAGKNLPHREYHVIDVGGGYKADAELFLPPGFSKDKKYPLLIHTYGGPGSQEVYDLFPQLSGIPRWLTYLASTHQVAVASVDGRGAGGRGDRYMYELWRRMGTVEVEDQAIAARYFQSLPYIDEDLPAAIYGWSYGGEVSSHALADYPVFGCAIAVAPVTSKRYYDTAYTERVMGFDLPTDNQDGYDDTDIVAKAGNFTGKKYLLAHGTSDDNVHFMNSAQLVKALVAANVQFVFRMYPDDTHSLSQQKNSFKHLLRSMTHFLVEDCWDMSDNTNDDVVVNSANRGSFHIFSLLITFLAILKIFEA